MEERLRKHIINKHIRLGGGDCQDPCKFSVLDHASLVLSVQHIQVQWVTEIYFFSDWDLIAKTGNLSGLRSCQHPDSYSGISRKYCLRHCVHPVLLCVPTILAR